MNYPLTKTKPWKHQVEFWEFVSGKNLTNMPLNASYAAFQMGCLDGDTTVQMLRAENGKKVTIKELYNFFNGINRTKRFNKNIPIYIRALIGDNFGQHLVKNVIKTGIKKTLKIVTESGKILALTPNHEILRADKKWIAAENFHVNDLIFVNGQPSCKLCGSTKKVIYYKYAKNIGICWSCNKKGIRNSNYKSGKFMDKDGYIRVTGQYSHHRSFSGSQVYEHILVMEKKLKRKILRNETIHHKDENKQNNNPENLELITTSNHNIVHKKFTSLNGGSTINGGKVFYIPKTEKIVSIEPYGEREVYDIVMADPYRNFVANGIVVHNCGKSKTAIDYSNGIDAKRIIIICPKKVIGVWPNQFRIHSHLDFHFLPLIKGSVKQKSILLKEFLDECIQTNRRAVVIINYDSYWRPPLGPVYKDNRLSKVGILASYQWDLMIADEAHRIKSPGSAASWGAKRLAKSSTRRLWLSGTPMSNAPKDLYAQFRSLDPSIFGTRFSDFKDKYCKIGGFNGKQIIGYKNLDELTKKFYSIAMYESADNALDLPDKQNIVINFDLDPSALKIYRQLDKELVSQIGNKEISADNVLVKLLRLAQLAGGFIKFDDKTTKIVDNNKIETTIEVLQGLPVTEPVVLFVRFRNELSRLTQAIEKAFKGKRIIGELSGRETIKDPSDFYDGIWHATKTNTLLVQIQTGGEGIDLTAARYCFFVSVGESLGMQQQARFRLWRPGQTRKVFYYHIIGNSTVDVKIMAAIKAKKRIVDFVIEGITGRPTAHTIQSANIQNAISTFGMDDS